jgi:hypothetical protein
MPRYLASTVKGDWVEFDPMRRDETGQVLLEAHSYRAVMTAKQHTHSQLVSRMVSRAHDANISESYIEPELACRRFSGNSGLETVVLNPISPFVIPAVSRCAEIVDAQYMDTI